jgi:predicted nucleic acid-binding protein
MAKRVLDTNVLINFWHHALGKRRLGDVSLADARRWGRDLLDLHDGGVVIVTPVFVEFLCGVQNARELALAHAFLAVFKIADAGEIPPKDWEETRRLAQRVPEDGKTRQMGDCLIRAICNRLKLEVLTGEKRFVRP